jgi:hypothetical protein
METLRYTNSQTILNATLNLKKNRVKRLNLHPTQNWNYFLSNSLSSNQRGSLFYLQAAVYLRHVFELHPKLNEIYEMKFFVEGSLNIIFLYLQGIRKLAVEKSFRKQQKIFVCCIYVDKFRMDGIKKTM